MVPHMFYYRFVCLIKFYITYSFAEKSIGFEIYPIEMMLPYPTSLSIGISQAKPEGKLNVLLQDFLVTAY